MRKQYYFRPSSHGFMAWDVDRLVQLSTSLPHKPVPLNDIRELNEILHGEAPTWRAMIDHLYGEPWFDCRLSSQ